MLRPGVALRSLVVDKSQRPSPTDESLEPDVALDPTTGGQAALHWVVMRQSNVWRPPTDVFEMEDRLVVLVEVAGMRDGEFNVALQERKLVISGVRRRMVADRMAFHQMEVRYGEFRTAISLPWPVERAQVSAKYKDGFLRVELPRLKNTGG
jgi:HSP20 family protein